MKILVTSSTGLTGRAIIKSLSAKGNDVRAMIHSEARKEEMLGLGASETVIASIESEEELRNAMSGMDVVIYICPNAHLREGEIGKMAVDIANQVGTKRFIYQSVHNSIEPSLPHHRQKLMVEQYLVESELNYSILRPAAFMQNILSSSTQIIKEHLFNQKFYKSADSTNLINLIDVDNYAAIVAKIATGKDYDYGCFDLCGPQNLSARDMLDAISNAVGTAVKLTYIPDETFIEIAQKQHMPDNKLSTLLAMFDAYNRYGFKGNPLTAKTLLGKELTDFKTFISKALQ